MPENRIQSCNRRFIRIAAITFAVAAVIAAGFMLLTRKSYTSTAWIQVLSDQPYLVFEEKDDLSYDRYVETQFALVRSPLIVMKALENPDVSRLGVVAKQRKRDEWLARSLRLGRVGNSEFVTISISTPDPVASEKIVNAVVAAYFEYFEQCELEWNSRLLQQLSLEWNRQKSASRHLQDEIRQKLETRTDENDKGDSLQITDVSYLQEQLERINRVIERISNRTVEIQTELNAPKRVQLRKKASVCSPSGGFELFFASHR